MPPCREVPADTGGGTYRMISADEVRQMVLQALPGAVVSVRDLTGTGDHWEISAEGPMFKGLTLIEQHRLVHAAVASEMDRRIHAIQVRTRAV